MTQPDGGTLPQDVLPLEDPPAEALPEPPKADEAPTKALAHAKATPDKLGRITLIVAAALAAVAAIAAPFQLSLIAHTKMKGALVAFFAALSLLLALRALLLRRKSPSGLLPGLFAVVAASLALTAAGFLAFQERGAALESHEGGRARGADLIAWELGRDQQRSRDLALSGGLSFPGFGLGALALGLGIGARRRAGAALEKAADDAKAAKGKRRKMVAAGWSALLLGAAVFAAGLAIDGLAIAAPVDTAVHPRIADLAKVREHLSSAHLDEACGLLELVLADKTPIDIVRAELPKVDEIAHRCIGHRIERLPKGLSCVERAATLASSETARLVHAEDRAKAGCDGALVGD